MPSPPVKSCAEAKAAQGNKPQDGSFLLTITAPPTAVYCVMGAKNVAPKTYLLLKSPVRGVFDLLSRVGLQDACAVHRSLASVHSEQEPLS